MRVNNLKIAKTVLFASALGAISLNLIFIDTKPSLAQSFSAQIYKPCNKAASVPEPYSFVGILAFGILGGGYLLKRRLRNRDNCLNHDSLLSVNDSSISNNQQSQQLSFMNLVGQKEENIYHLSPSFELKLIEPTQIG